MSGITLLGAGIHTVSAAAATSSFTHSASVDTGSFTVGTFNTVGIGTATATRQVLVGVSLQSATSGTSPTITSVTIDGGGGAQSMTAVASSGIAWAAQHYIQWWQYNLTVGTTATVVVTATANCDSQAIRVYSLDGVSATVKTVATNQQGYNSTASTTSVNIASGQIALSLVDCWDKSTRGTWGNTTQDGSVLGPTDSATATHDYVDSATSTTVGTPTAITWTPSGSTLESLSTVVFGP